MVAGAASIGSLTSHFPHAGPEGETPDRTLHAASLSPTAGVLLPIKQTQKKVCPLGFFLTTSLCRDCSGLPLVSQSLQPGILSF